MKSTIQMPVVGFFDSDPAARRDAAAGGDEDVAIVEAVGEVR
jgi:hypothetical protein